MEKSIYKFNNAYLSKIIKGNEDYSSEELSSEELSTELFQHFCNNFGVMIDLKFLPFGENNCYETSEFHVDY